MQGVGSAVWGPRYSFNDLLIGRVPFFDNIINRDDSSASEFAIYMGHPGKVSTQFNKHESI